MCQNKDTEPPRAWPRSSWCGAGRLSSSAACVVPIPEPSAPTQSRSSPPTSTRTETREVPLYFPSAKVHVPDLNFLHGSHSTVPYALCRSTILEGETAANFPTVSKIAPGVTFETSPVCYANFFSGGEQKLFFPLFFPCWKKKKKSKTPF